MTYVESGILASLYSRYLAPQRGSSPAEKEQQRSNRFKFICNFCGTLCENDANAIHREIPDCEGCGSTPRFRGLGLALSEALSKPPLAFKDLPSDKTIRGFGMSDWEPLNKALSQKFDHTHSRFHNEPRFIKREPPSSGFDYVLCTEVFEHILAPLEDAFANLHEMLRPGGVLAFSTPYTLAPETSEHFPGMIDFRLGKVDGEWLLRGIHADGECRNYRNLVFHGGPGTVLEMRVYGQKSLMRLLEGAGFTDVRPLQWDESVGYFWQTHIDRPEIGYPSINQIITARRAH